MILGLGVTAGAHRLWSHRSYKAKLPLRIFLCICHSIAGQVNRITIKEMNEQKLSISLIE
jgi:fatty-acid desaturase